MKKRLEDKRVNMRTMIVSTEGKSYAETVKSIKTTVAPEAKGATIQKVAQTKDGNVLAKK